MSTVAAIAVVAGAAIQYDASRTQAAAQEERGRVQSASQKVKDRSNLRQQAREARVQRARIQQQAEATGTSGSSKEGGALGSLSTQLSASQGSVAGQANTANVVTGLNSDIASAQKQAALGSLVQSAGSYGFEKTGGFDNLFGD
tara:strand:- start:30164 stop:30595 length:432 start_codon:yes stop_codon:yes gene_type:complete